MTHAKKAKEFLRNKKKAQWHDITLRNVRHKRDIVRDGVPEWEELRENATTIKSYVLNNLEKLWLEFEKNATANGITIHWAKTKETFNKTVEGIIKESNGKNVVKSKSMLTEETELNKYLISKGIDIVESDLGERIIQFREETPSHIVLPAIHLDKEDIGDTFHKHIGLKKGVYDGPSLVLAARGHLREKFMHADIAISGVNFAVASKGSLTVCTNEGNADMGTSLAPVHIACVGIEKIIPDLKSLATFTRLLARSATGQYITNYTSHFLKPPKGQKMHIIILDDGRSDILHKKGTLKDVLKCIRCGACMNTCPVYRNSGGHSYSYYIPGPIGLALGSNYGSKYYGNLTACSGCYSCEFVCPVKIPLKTNIYKWRVIKNREESSGMIYKIAASVLAKPNLFNTAMSFAKIAKFIPKPLLNSSGWVKYRGLPDMTSKTFTHMYENRKGDK